MPRNKIRIFSYFIISSTQPHDQKMQPNIKVELCKELENGIEVNISLNLSEHKDKCSEDAEVYFQAYSNKGKGLPNFFLGKFGDLSKPSKEYSEWKHIFCEDLNKEDAKFKVIVSEWGEFNNTKVPKIRGIGLINDFYANPQSGEKRLVSWIETKEDKDLQQLFAVEMEPNEKPKLLLKKGANIKFILDNKNECIQRTLIYTAVVREIVTNYLIDSNFNTCEIRNKWWDKLSNLLEEPIKDFPESLIRCETDRDYEIDEDARQFIEKSVAAMVSDKVEPNNERLIDGFIRENNDLEIETEDEA